MKMQLRRSGACFLALAGIAGLPRVAHADPNDYVIELDINKGEREFDSKLGAASSAPDGTPAAQAAALAWGMGVTDRWFSEGYVQFANQVAGTNGGGLDSVSWENVVRFTEPGEYPVDFGAVVEMEKQRADSQGWKVTLGPMVQADVQGFQLNANLLFVRVLGADVNPPLQVEYQYQVRQRSGHGVDFGVQGFGGVRSTDEFGHAVSQGHRVGPALFGRHRTGPGQAIKYNVGLLFGLSDGAPRQTLRAQIEYEY
jgi:hypothetical protein